jgi:hypothetical protein
LFPGEAVIRTPGIIKTGQGESKKNNSKTVLNGSLRGTKSLFFIFPLPLVRRKRE